jgi:hypothetical protein
VHEEERRGDECMRKEEESVERSVERSVRGRMSIGVIFSSYSLCIANLNVCVVCVYPQHVVYVLVVSSKLTQLSLVVIVLIRL